VREGDGLDKLLEADEAVAVPADALDVFLDGGEELFDFLDALCILFGDVGRNGFVELADSEGRELRC
jgi:hypothetical protein